MLIVQKQKNRVKDKESAYKSEGAPKLSLIFQFFIVDSYVFNNGKPIRRHLVDIVVDRINVLLKKMHNECIYFFFTEKRPNEGPILFSLVHVSKNKKDPFFILLFHLHSPTLTPRYIE